MKREDHDFYSQNFIEGGGEDDRQYSIRAISGSQIIRAYGVPGIAEAPSEQEITTRILDTNASHLRGENRQLSQPGNSSYSHLNTPKMQNRSTNDLNNLTLKTTTSVAGANNPNNNNFFLSSSNANNPETYQNSVSSSKNQSNSINAPTISQSNGQNIQQVAIYPSSSSIQGIGNYNNQRLESYNQGTGISYQVNTINNMQITDQDDREEEYQDQQINQYQQTKYSHSGVSTNQNKSCKTSKTTKSNQSTNNNKDINKIDTNNNNNENNQNSEESIVNSTKTVQIICPFCQKLINTSVTYSPSCKTHLASFGFCLFGFACGLCFIPYYFQEKFQTVIHTCPNCRTQISKRIY